MTSAVISPETKDTPPLTVAITKLSSSSPFPSPGSPFFPPPIPSAHEYALLAPLSKRRSTDSRMNVGSKTDHESAASTHPDGVTTATAFAGNTSSTITKAQPTLDKRRESADTITNGSSSANCSPASFSHVEPDKPDSKTTLNGQTTPTVNSAGSEAPTASQPSHDDILDDKSSADDDAGGTPVSPSTPPPGQSSQIPHTADRWCSTSATPSSFIPTTTTEDSAKPSLDNPKPPSRSSLRQSRDSFINSSRPAPPSPADSPRASTVLSRHSSTRSRPGSSLTPANTHSAEAASPTTPTPNQLQHQQQQQQQQQQPQNAAHRASTSTSSAVASPPNLVKIRDFAFPDEDQRHTGTGPFTPRPNRRLQRPLSTWSASSASSAGSEGRDDGAGGGSSFGYSGWGFGRLGWFGARSSVGSAGGAGASEGPSQGDFARNFTDMTSPDCEIEDPYDSLDNEDEEDVDEVQDRGSGGVGAGGQENSERPLLPGWYRALYAFEPEGTAEMALAEDQIVRVIGRGGGVGWAIVARGGDEGHALVPEGYLELVSLDRDQVGEEEEG